MKIVIEKNLSGTDIGLTSTHQSGIYIPKDVLKFFPSLDTKSKNPRIKIIFKDIYGENNEFNFIYYNNKFFGGTRNEYRLTGINSFIKSRNLLIGDLIKLIRENKEFYIHYKKMKIKREINTGFYNWKIYNLVKEIKNYE